MIVSLTNPNVVVTRIGNQKFHCRNVVAKPSSKLFPSSSSLMKLSPIASKFSPLITTNRYYNSLVIKRFDTHMEWQECKFKQMNQFLHGFIHFIRKVMQVLKDKSDLSKWALKYKALGQNLEYSWLAKNLQPLPNQKIHWISLEGLPNRGTIRLFPQGPSSCEVEIRIIGFRSLH